ncbi:MAG: peptide chain release factor N(5)-glutamine methyltransferase [Muribaculum sp.]|nr:peptide chain release factor N(5)-glutamine methyltransferase [Muribaculum sp.]
MTTEPTLKELFESLRLRLTPMYGAGEADAMTKIIVEDMLHYTPVDAVLRKDTTISAFMCGKIDKVVERLLSGEPLQYILGKARFYGADLRVTPAVLIPRPETEELVDIVVKEQGDKPDLKVLDLCTGSGCIAVTLARVLKFATVTGVDISADALEVAADNAHSSRVKVRWVLADVLTMLPSKSASYDIIVSNPPYVLESEKAEMEGNVLDYEPHLALFVPDSDPLEFYRPIADYASKVLAPGGRIYLEINPLSASSVADCLKSRGFKDVDIIRDISGKQRFVTATSPTDYD